MVNADIEADMFWNIPPLFHRIPVSGFLLRDRIYFGRFLPTCLRRRDTCRITWRFVRGSRPPEEILTARNSRYTRKGSSVSIHVPYRDHVNRQSIRKDYAKLLWTVSGWRFYFEKKSHTWSSEWNQRNSKVEQQLLI